MISLIVIFLSIFVVTTNGQAVCDAVGPNCNVVTNINFQNLDSVMFAYPNPGPTIVDGVTYDAVIKWTPESGHSLIHTFEIYKLNQANPFDCSQSKLWNNGVIASSSSYTRGPSNDQDYCIFDISGVFNRTDLMNPSEVYFLLKGLTTAGNQIFIDRNYDTPVVAKEDTIYYLYELFQTTLSTDGTNTVISLNIDNITYDGIADFGGIGSCNTMETLLATIDVSGCSLSLVSSDNVNGIYTYNLPKTDYETCSDTVTGINNIITYHSTITLPISSGSCYYFREGDHQQSINIALDVSNIGGDQNVTDLADVSVQVWDYDLERCDPFSYVLPQHRAIFYVNYTFSGDSLALDGTKTPQLDEVANPLSVESSTCVTHPSGSGNECMYVFKSTECRPVFITTDEESCVVDRFNDNILKEMGVVVTTNSVPVTHNFDIINTVLENVLFNISYCEAPANVNATNVTDTYSATLTARNLPNPDFGTDPPFIAFYNELIFQMVVDAGTLTSSDFQIQTVTVTLRDPADDSVIAKKVFNKGDKEILHNFDWTHYYDDVHFCSYHYSNNTCDVYYNPITDRVNDFYTSTLASRLASVCQTSIDNSTSDYFTFDPPNWFLSPQLPTVDINVNIIAVLNLCDGSGARRLLRREMQDTEIVNIEFIDLTFSDDEVRTLLYVDPTPQPTTAPPPTSTPAPTTDTPAPASSSSTSISADVGIIVGGTIGGLVATSCGVWFFIGARRRWRRREYRSPGRA